MRSRLTTGSIFWVVVALAGVAALLARHPLLASVVRLTGAAYLGWYGTRLLWSAIRHTPKPVGPVQAAGGTYARAAAYRTGLLTGVTNPKGAAFWTSAFAALFPANAPTWFCLATVVTVAVMSLAWHLGITAVFGTAALRRRYLRIERAVNGLAGGALVVLGIQRVVLR